MPLDPSIIMGFKPTVELADPNKVQSEQLANQFNQAKLQEVQQGIQTKNAMRQLDPNAPDYASQVMRLDPETGIKYGAYASKLASEQVKTQLDKMQASRENNANLAFNPSDANVTAHIEDSLLRKDITYDQAMGSLEKVLGNPSKGISPMPMQARKDYFLHLGLTADQAVKEMSSNLDRDVQMRGQDITKRGQDITAGITGRGQNIVRDTAKRAQDITLQGQNKSVYDPALSGFVSRDGTFTPVKSSAINQPRAIVSDVVSEMRNGYDELNKVGAIKSTERKAGQNLVEGVATSGIGQLVGQIAGTPEQQTRDFIKGQRPILIQAIMRATGMKASQMNSDRELQNMLDSATDPSKGYETNIRTLDLIEKRYGLSGGGATGGGVNVVPKVQDVTGLTVNTPQGAIVFQTAAGASAYKKKYNLQ